MPLYRYSDSQAIGHLLPQFENEFRAMAQQPQNIIRLGALPHAWYSLGPDFQGTNEDTTVYC